jgi:hypothetical protein
LGRLCATLLGGCAISGWVCDLRAELHATATDADGGRSAPAQQAAAAVVNRAHRPMLVGQVAAKLGKSENATAASLRAAASKGALRKVGVGLYAPRYYPTLECLLPFGEGET